MMAAFALMLSVLLGTASAQGTEPLTEVSIAQLQANAERGDAEAQYLLGVRYSKGDVVPLDKV